MLKCNSAVRKFTVLGAVNCFLPIERHGKRRALGSDLIDVPFAGRFLHGRNLCDVDNRPGAIGRIGSLVPDVDFISGGRSYLGGIGAANEDTAVGGIIDPELSPELKVAVGVLRDQKAVAS